MHKEGKTKARGLWIGLVSVLCAVALLFSALVSVPLITNICVYSVSQNIIEEYSGEKYDCILVLGAGIRGNSTPSDMLADRLDVAIKLYFDGASDIILLSGDRSGDDYDEVAVMENYCLLSGVPSSAIVKDEKGYSTFESMLNTKNDGRFKNIIVVTQRYHLYRAMYVGEQIGLTVHGADAELRGYSGQTYRDLREVAARTKDFFLVMLYGED